MPKPARVHPIDFSRPSKFTKDQERRLLTAHQTFCRTAGSRLSSELRAPIDFEVVGHKQLTWLRATAEAPAGAIPAVIEIQPIGRRLLLLGDRRFYLMLIERLLGGEMRDVPEPRRFTDVEVALARTVVERLLDQLSIAWHDMAEVGLAFAAFEPDAESATLASLSEPSWVLTIEARVSSSSFELSVVVPYRSIEPLNRRLPASADESLEAADPSAGRLVHAALGEAEIELRAEAGATALTAEDVVALSVGDVIRLDAPADSGVTLFAGEVPVHRARPGRAAGRRAVQVLAPSPGRP